uniref:Uncharacterized protein n=1 Tax=viral metagenome TaxID=1070528 RepID=A0A6H2A5U8_9ZZZZ
MEERISHVIYRVKVQILISLVNCQKNVDTIGELKVRREAN